MRKNNCYFISAIPRIVVRRTAAIGDVIAATAVADKISELGLGCVFQAAPAMSAYLRRAPNVAALGDLIDTPDVNLDQTYEKDPHRTYLHFSELFLSAANAQLASRGISLGPATNCRPSLTVAPEEKEPYRKRLAGYARPWVFVCPRSNAWVNRTIPDYLWEQVAPLVQGTCFWVGTHAAAPKPFVDLHIRHLETLLLYLACADILVTVDTGPLHLAAALGVPAVAFEQASSPNLHLSDQRDFIAIPHPTLECLNCQKNVCPKDAYLPPCQKFPPEWMAEAINQRLAQFRQDSVSAVIPTFHADPDRLRQCVELVSSQVSEVIITLDAGGIVPSGIEKFPKVKIVQHRLPHLGFGKNVNFGVRHTNSRSVLILNDDVYLHANAVDRLKECLKPGVGMVGHLLWYPDGTIQHGGKYRKPGMRGWGHIDHRARTHTIKQPMACENVTAASILVNRKAFYDAGGFDEDFFMYAEDDALCLQMRRAGYEIMYTPLAVGTHLESQSSTNRHKLHELIEPSNRLFDKKWGWWIQENLHRVPGVFT